MTPLKILHKNPICSFDAPWLADTINQYLKFEPWDPAATYPRNTLFYLNLTDFSDSDGVDFCTQLTQQGFRVVIDNLWEPVPAPVPNTHRIACDKWFWINESLWYQYLGYDTYTPEPDPVYLALLPMNRSRPHRTEFLAEIEPILDQCLWSYVEAGRQLPNDRDMNDWTTQRYMNPDWYNSCYISAVVETLVRAGSKYTPVFITEKTMKPLAFQHPFIVYGNRGTLAQLRLWGFETFDNLWAETYDTLVDVSERKHAVVQLLSSIKPEPHSPETQRRLKHNRSHFFDTKLLKQMLVEQILEPIIHYATTDI